MEFEGITSACKMLTNPVIAFRYPEREDGVMPLPLPDARQLSDEVLEALRLRALRGRERGFTEDQLADLLGVARKTVSRWWSAYAADGLEPLPHRRTGRRIGSGRTLNAQQAAHIQQILNAHNPQEAGIAAPSWTRRAVRDLIRREYGITMPVRTVGEYLGRWGFTRKGPSRHAKDQTRVQVGARLRQTWPAVKARSEL